MRIGIFGGCFNPPHNMHKDIGLNLIRGKYLDWVIYVPTGDQYQKEELIPAKERYHMLKIMTRDQPNLSVSDIEMKETLTYTYQTLDYFQKKYKEDEIYFICGSDNLDQITTWKNYQYILNHYKLLVIKRDCFQLNHTFKNVIEVDMPMSNISSTMIRDKLKSRKNCKYLDSQVKNYIKERKLYED